MGMAAAELSDLVILTSDNPRSEDPLGIMNDAMVGMRRFDTPHRDRAGSRESHSRSNRAGGPGDVVLLAGKGHETYQVLKDKTITFRRSRGRAKDTPRIWVWEGLKHTAVLVSRCRGAMDAETTLTGEVSSFSIDSRTLQPGTCSLRSRGMYTTGTSSSTDVLARGASAAVVHRDIGRDDPRLIGVNDTSDGTAALAQWASARLGRQGGRRNGQRGQDDNEGRDRAVLGPQCRVGKTIGNFNNHVGLPLSCCVCRRTRKSPSSNTG